MTDAESPGERAAVLARGAIEEALFALSDVALLFDREGVKDRLLRAVSLTYAVSDSSVLAVVHIQGLTEAAAIVGETTQMLEQAGDRTAVPSLRRVLEHLRLAGSALRSGADAVAQIQLARRAELVGGLQDAGPPPPRPFRASHGVPQLFALARPPLLPHVTVAPTDPLADAAPPPPPKPTSFEQLAALAARFSAPLDGPRVELAAAPEEAAYEVAAPEADVLRRLARDCLEDVALGRTLRTPNAMEGWRDQGPFEARLLASLDAFATYAGAALPMVSLYHAEASAPDPERAFAVALVLGCIEGADTVGAALMTLKQSAPETHPGWIDGFSLASSPVIDRAMGELATSPRAPLARLAMEVLYRRGATPAELARSLVGSSDPGLACAAARALGVAGPRDEAIGALEEATVRTEDDGVWLAAVEALLVRRHAPARELLRQVLAKGSPEGRVAEAATLLALVGHGTDADSLRARFRLAPSPSLARALGRFGSAAVFSELLGALSSEDEDLVAAAAEALERITGAGLFTELEEPWPVELPPGADDPALGALPVPTRKRRTNVRDPAVWREWLRDAGGKFELKPKWRGGAPFLPAFIVAELAEPRTPSERRFEAARELALVTGLGPFFADDWVVRQEGRLAELAREVDKLDASPGAWSLGLVSAGAPSPPLAAASPKKLGLTMGFVMPDLRGVLPFAAGGGRAVAPPSVEPAPVVAPSMDTGTSGPQPSPLAPALPFVRSVEALAAEAPPAAPSAPVAPSSPLPAWIPSAPVEETAPSTPSPITMQAPVAMPAPVDLGATVSGAPSPLAQALPFRAGAAHAPSIPYEAPVAREGLPFRSPPPNEPPSFTLEQYAAVSTEILLRPAARRETLLRYGIADAATWVQLDGWFQARMAKDPAMRARWTELVQQYRLAMMRR